MRNAMGTKICTKLLVVVGSMGLITDPTTVIDLVQILVHIELFIWYYVGLRKYVMYVAEVGMWFCFTLSSFF